MASNLITGLTMRARTADGRWVWFSQPLIDPSFRACGVWGGDTELINAAMLFLHTDPEESPADLRSVAMTLLYVCEDGGTADSIVYLLVDRHPRTEMERDRAWKRWRNNSGLDGPAV